jgi:hypothetical protein
MNKGRKRTVIRPSRWTIVTGLMALAYGLVAVGHGLDRVTDTNDDLISYVPALFADRAHINATQQALGNHQVDVATREATAALAASPLSDDAVALLGTAQWVGGGSRAAETTFLVGARLGWRARPTQVFLIDRAINRGNYGEAVDRLDALLRQSPQLLRMPQVMAPIEQNLFAQEAFVAKLTQRPPWLGAFLSDVFQLPAEQLGIRAALVADLGIAVSALAVPRLIRWCSS